MLDTLVEYQVVEVNGERTIGKQDAFRAFMERNAQLLAKAGWTGVVVPSAFHANEGATGIRRLYLQKLSMRHCYSFENRRRLFEIHGSFKFATVVARAGQPTDEFSCAFYLHNDEWLFGDRKERQPLRYKLDFVQRTGGDYLNLFELRSSLDFEVAEKCFTKCEPFGQVCSQIGVHLGRELNITDDAWRFTTTDHAISPNEDSRAPQTAVELRSRGFLTVYEGKYFHQFDDRWGDRPKFLISVADLSDKPTLLKNATLFRLAYRKIQNSQNARTWIQLLLPPGCLFADSALCERHPNKASNLNRLIVQAISSSFSADWLLRQKSTANVNLFMLAGIPIPMPTPQCRSFVSRASLRLTCNHAGYAPLWREQLGESWRESGHPPLTWPVLSGDDERWRVRAAIDAVVADAYGLSRDQYAQPTSSPPSTTPATNKPPPSASPRSTNSNKSA